MRNCGYKDKDWNLCTDWQCWLKLHVRWWLIHRIKLSAQWTTGARLSRSVRQNRIPRVQGLICLPKLIIPPRGPLVKLYCILLLKNRECRVPYIATESVRVLARFCSPLTRDLSAKAVKSKKESKQLIIKFYVKKGKENQPDVRGRRINRFRSR